MRIRSLLQFAALAASLAACSPPLAEITPAEQALLDRPSAAVMAKVDAQLQARLPLQAKLDAYILANGRRLSTQETILARAIGVREPARVRILEVPHIPLRNTAEKLMRGTPIPKPPLRIVAIGGLQTGYGLVIDTEYLTEGWLLAHELAHVHQFEKLGRAGMMRKVLIEHAVLGDKLIPTEREAIAISEAATGAPAPDYHH